MDMNCGIDMAAWVQAIGSILALAITIFLYYHQINKENRESRKYQVFLMKYFATTAESLCKEIESSIEREDNMMQELIILSGRCKDLSDWSIQFKVDTLNLEELSNFAIIRDAIHKISLWIDSANETQIRRQNGFISAATKHIIPMAKELNKIT